MTDWWKHDTAEQMAHGPECGGGLLPVLGPGRTRELAGDPAVSGTAVGAEEPYRDHSGVADAGRPGLAVVRSAGIDELIQQWVKQRSDFTFILCADESRWARFDIDASAMCGAECRKTRQASHLHRFGNPRRWQMTQWWEIDTPDHTLGSAQAAGRGVLSSYGPGPTGELDPDPAGPSTGMGREERRRDHSGVCRRRQIGPHIRRPARIHRIDGSVVKQRSDFTYILCLEVSRGGRFEDIDLSAQLRLQDDMPAACTYARHFGSWASCTATVLLRAT